MAFIGPTLVLYAVVGLGVAVAVYVSERAGHSPGIWFRVATALPFWPLYLPVLLSHSPPAGGANEPASDSTPPMGDEMSTAIGQVDAELEAALNSLDGWAEDVLAREKDRIRELREAWYIQANRVREMDRLFDTGFDRLMLGDRARNEESRKAPVNNRLALSEEACRQNIERLRCVRRRAYDDLMGSLAWVRELVSMIHLAKFTGAPASRAEELVAQIAAAVEGLSDLTWREEAQAPVSDCRSRVK